MQLSYIFMWLRAKAAHAPVSTVPPHVSEECFWVQACRWCRGSSYSRPDHAWIVHVHFKCIQYCQTSKLSMKRQDKDKDKVSSEEINPAGQDRFHRLEFIRLSVVLCFSAVVTV